jgi:hypothetical protein
MRRATGSVLPTPLPELAGMCLKWRKYNFQFFD